MRSRDLGVHPLATPMQSVHRRQSVVRWHLPRVAIAKLFICNRYRLRLSRCGISDNTVRRVRSVRTNSIFLREISKSI